MKISQINIYPIKGLSVIRREESVVEERGLRHDRRWMLTDPDGVFLTQREHPKMAAIGVEMDANGLTVTAKGFDRIKIPMVPDSGDRRRVVIWQSDVTALEYAGYVNEWFSDVLSRNCRLVLMPEESQRPVSERFNQGRDIVSFADGYPLLLTGEGSLAELNRRIVANSAGEGDGVPLEMRRFRPNLVVSGSEPFEEDRWARVKVGEALFRVVKPCARCAITTVDPDRGEFDGKEPLRTLAVFRMAKEVFPATFEELGLKPNSVLFGENLIPENPGVVVRIGDEIEVLDIRK